MNRSPAEICPRSLGPRRAIRAGGSARSSRHEIARFESFPTEREAHALGASGDSVVKDVNPSQFARQRALGMVDHHDGGPSRQSVLMAQSCGKRRIAPVGVFDKVPTDLAIHIARKHDRVECMEKRVAILVADGFTDSGLSVTLDVLRNQRARGPVRKVARVPYRRGLGTRRRRPRCLGTAARDGTVRGRGRAGGRRSRAVDLGGGRRRARRRSRAQ